MRDILVTLGLVLLVLAGVALVLCIPAFVLWSLLWVWNQFPHAPASPSPTGEWSPTWWQIGLVLIVAAFLWEYLDVKRKGR